MPKVIKSLNAVTEDSIGAVLDVGGLATDVTIQVSASGISPDVSGVVIVETSLDGVNWTIVGGPFLILLVSLADISTSRGNFPAMTQGSLARRIAPGPTDSFAVPHFRYVRATLGGLTDTGVTVTAQLAVTGIEAGSFLPF